MLDETPAQRPVVATLRQLSRSAIARWLPILVIAVAMVATVFIAPGDAVLHAFEVGETVGVAPRFESR